LSTNAHESPQLLAFAAGYGICVAVGVTSGSVAVYDEPETRDEVPRGEAMLVDETVETLFIQYC
jgi:hypothetical protein